MPGVRSGKPFGIARRPGEAQHRRRESPPAPRARIAAAVAARAEVEFAGYMRTPQGEVKFVLSDSAAQQSSEWLGIGGSFAGYRVTGFEAPAEMLTVEKDGTSRKLRLKNAATTAAPTGREPLRDAKLAVENAQRLIEAAARGQVKLLNEQDRLLVDNRQTLREKLARLRSTLPEGHPDILQLEAGIATLTQRMDRNELERNRYGRTIVLGHIRDAKSPAEKTVMEESLRALDAGLAKAGVKVEPADDVKIFVNGRPPPVREEP